METLINLEDLLKHEILDLYSAEEQIIDALPQIIEKADDPFLKKALSDHLEITKRQKDRLDKIKKVMMLDGLEDAKEAGFFSKLFGGNKSVKCKGIEGLLTEASKIMNEDMNAETMDAAIIGAAQKVEHYEIAGYGTAHAYALQLGLGFVAAELEKTLNEEYDADEALTELAIDDINVSSEFAVTDDIEADEDDAINTDFSQEHNIPGVNHVATSPIDKILP